MYSSECRVPKNSKRDKKALLSDQCKETGKQQNGKDQRSLRENQRYQGTISCKNGHNKGQKQFGPREAEEIKKWQEYTEKLHKKDLIDPDNHNGVIAHLEPDILECEVKWVLEVITTNKASGERMEFLLSYFSS